ncbi:hypothetical protein SCA6_009777 [Theobroma cacao]
MPWACQGALPSPVLVWKVIKKRWRESCMIMMIDGGRGLGLEEKATFQSQNCLYTLDAANGWRV